MRLIYVLMKELGKARLLYRKSGNLRLALLHNKGHKLLSKKNYDDAIKAFQKGLDIIDKLNTLRVFTIRQIWQFDLERAYFLDKRGRVEDPLFSCEILLNSGDNNCKSLDEAIGDFNVELTPRGYLITGYYNIEKNSIAEICINSRVIKTIRLPKKPIISGFLLFYIKRELLATFTAESKLEVRISSGGALLFNGSKSVMLKTPHGNGKLFSILDNGGVVNKKGSFAPTKAEIEERQRKYLLVYESARDFFNSRFNNSLFLMYGTVLGFFRDGDYIKGDDDFDAGWFSNFSTAEEVKEETKKIIVELVLSGFTCNFNRAGRLARLKLPNDDAVIHLDIRPIWYEDGWIWAHKQARMALKPEDFIPAKEGILRGTKIFHPAETEKFLKAYYGEGWNVPDPSYTNAAKIPGSLKRKLKSVCIKPSDYREMCEEIEAKRKDYPDSGKFISNGSESLYPLEEYEANCEW